MQPVRPDAHKLHHALLVDLEQQTVLPGGDETLGELADINDVGCDNLRVIRSSPPLQQSGAFAVEQREIAQTRIPDQHLRIQIEAIGTVWLEMQTIGQTDPADISNRLLDVTAYLHKLSWPPHAHARRHTGGAIGVVTWRFEAINQ